MAITEKTGNTNFCFQCGVCIHPESRFCHHCGVQITGQLSMVVDDPLLEPKMLEDGQPNIKTIQSAHFYRRLTAFILDLIFLFIIIMIINLLLDALFDFSYSAKDTIFLVNIFIISAVYFMMAEGAGINASYGKYILNIKVIPMNDTKMSYFYALSRYWAGIFSFLLLGGGFLWVFVSKRKLALNDIMSSTLVVDSIPISKPSVNSLDNEETSNE